MTGRILIVDDVATNRIVLKVKLSSAFYDVIQSSSGRKALDVARAERPDLIILDTQLSDVDGMSVCRALRSDPITENIPIIMITSSLEKNSKLSALHAGADDIFIKPIDELNLLARVRSLLRASGTDDELRLRASTCRELGFAETQASFETPGKIALIAAQKETALHWQSLLETQGKSCFSILSRNEALQALHHNPIPDLFIIAEDLDCPDDGLRLLSELKSRAETRYVPVLMVLKQPSHSQAVVALDLGASDLIGSDFDPEELALRVQSQIKRKRQSDRLREAVQEGLRMAVIDPLTGLYNRRYALPHLEHIVERAQQTNRSFAVMILDLDRFKNVNDRFGHAAGDEVLIEVANRIKNNLRNVDLVARIGGEEFLIAMPDTPLNVARVAAERVRNAVEESPIEIGALPDKLNVTLSVGVAMGGGEKPDLTGLLARADRALYSAKTDGRNQVTVSLSAA